MGYEERMDAASDSRQDAAAEGYDEGYKDGLKVGKEEGILIGKKRLFKQFCIAFNCLVGEITEKEGLIDIPKKKVKKKK